jgi:DMSO/TMAO reductase YedYZ molybdopterin-dependent catalytic subunit
MKVSRRKVLHLAKAAPAAVVAGLFADAEELVDFADYSADFRIEAQERDPRVKVFDLRRLTEWTTSASEFFTFHQTAQPAPVHLRDWRLRISGCVDRPVALTFEDLQRRPLTEVAATIECAGNNRQPPLMNGLVSNGVWRGPALAPLLRSCGVQPEAREVVFFGADTERERKWPAAGQEFEAPHGRSLFVQDALDGGAILAIQLNGEALPPEHGYPLRLIVPGWYGMAHVKWLSGIAVLDRRYEGRHMARNYHAVRRSSGDGEALVLETSITRNRLKSVVARVTRRPSPDGFAYAISGAAWGGRNSIERVEVRIDSGPWLPAEIYEKGSPDAWSLWRVPWLNTRPGSHTIVSRAIDSRGAVQPDRAELARTQFSAREDHSQWPRRITIP